MENLGSRPHNAVHVYGGMNHAGVHTWVVVGHLSRRHRRGVVHVIHQERAVCRSHFRTGPLELILSN